MKTVLTLAVALAAAVVAPVAQAQTKMEIGRLKVVLAESGWERFPVAASDADIKLNGGVSEIAGESALLVLRRPDNSVAAAMVVGGTWGYKTRVRSTNNCKPVDWLYVYDLSGGSNDTMECVWAGGAFATPQMLSGVVKRLGAALQPLDIKLPPKTLPFMAFLINGRGSIVQVAGLVAPDFVGIPNQTPLGTLPTKTPAPVALAAWADAMGAAAKDGLGSMSGEVKLPAMTFATPNAN